MLKSCLVAIAKDEDKYIEEWLAYHLKIGFDKIIVIRNNWSYEPKLADDRFVFIDDNANDVYAQPRAYTTTLRRFCDEFEWMAFWDIDEFITLKKHRTINEFLSDYDDFYAVGINWRMFGDSHLKYDRVNNSVLDRFTMCGRKLSDGIKTIVHTRLTGKNVYKDIHHMISPLGGMVNVAKKPMTGTSNFGDLDEIIEIAYLNHYRNKTLEECLEKCLRNDNGFSGVLKYVENFNQEFDKHNLNEVHDFSAREFFHGGQT